MFDRNMFGQPRVFGVSGSRLGRTHDPRRGERTELSLCHATFGLCLRWCSLQSARPLWHSALRLALCLCQTLVEFVQGLLHFLGVLCQFRSYVCQWVI